MVVVVGGFGEGGAERSLIGVETRYKALLRGGKRNFDEGTRCFFNPGLFCFHSLHPLSGDREGGERERAV